MLEQVLGHLGREETHGRAYLLEHAAKLQAPLVELGDELVRIDVGARRARALQASLAQRRED